MTLLTVLVALLVLLLVAGACFGIRWIRQFQQQLQSQMHQQWQEQAERASQDGMSAAVDAAVGAAVSTVLVERNATTQSVVADRERTVEAVVQTAVTTSKEQLDSRMEQNAQVLDQRTKSFEQRAQGIDRQVAELTALVQQLRKEKGEQQAQFNTALTESMRQNAQLHQTTDQLRSVLGGKQKRGQWGERMAEDVLEMAGFAHGVNYRKQTSVEGGRPDFTFLLPRGLELNMDVKFPIENYVRFLDADNDRDRDEARRRFASDVRTHVKALGSRNYIEPGRTVETVLMFIPNESVYSFLHENDVSIIDTALRHKVVLCSPMTLFSVLAVIRQAVDNFRLEKRSDEILTVLGSFKNEWTNFTEHMDKVRKNISALDNNFAKLEGPRRNQLQRQLDKIDRIEASNDPVVDLTDAPTAVAAEPPSGPSAQPAAPVPADDPVVRQFKAS